MELNEIFALMERFDGSGLSALDLEWRGAHLRLEKGGATAPTAPAPVLCAPTPAPAAPPAPVVEAPVTECSAAVEFIKAPLVGTFYSTSAPGKEPFAPVGATVRQGQTVCVLEAMKMMSEIPAPFDCAIEEVLCADGELAGFDSPLFRVRHL